MTGVAARSVLWLKDLPSDAVSKAGGKGASLAKMARAGLPVPPAFVVCAEAFEAFLDAHQGKDFIHRTINGLNVLSESDLNSAAEATHAFICSKPIPDQVAGAIRVNYAELGANVPVAVR